MDIGSRIKKYRERQGITQDELALKVFVSRQTISNWENNKSYPDIKSLIMLTNIFNVSLDDFIRGDIELLKKKIDESKIKRFNIMGVIFTAELLIVVISSYPLFKFAGNIGIIIWGLFVLITFGTAFLIEQFKKSNDIQTYKEVIAFIEKKPLTYEEAQQEKGKRIYEKILMGILAGVITLIVSLIIILIIDNI